MITDEQLAELEAAEAKATPGPWESGQWIKPDNGPEIFAITVPASGTPGWRPCVYSDRGDDSDTSFIALARNNLKALISEIRSDRRLQADMEAENKSIHEENQTLRAQLADAQGKLHEREAVLRMQAEWFNELTGAFGTGSAVEIKEKCDTLRAQLEIAKEALEECSQVKVSFFNLHGDEVVEHRETIQARIAREALAKISGGGK